MIILGIDPGSIKSGYAVLEVQGRKIVHIASGTLKFSSKTPFLERLLEIKQKIAALALEFKPNHLALESLIYVKDPAALIKLSQTRGVIISEVLEYCQGNVFEYSPNSVKATVSGHGHASKESMQKAVNMILNIGEFDTHDQSDAVAIALCHAFNRQSTSPMIKSKTVRSSRSTGLQAALAHKIQG